MTTHPYPELISASREGSTVTLTYLRQDDSTSTLSMAAPLLYGVDAKVHHPVRLLTLYPEGQPPMGFFVTADRLQGITQTLTNSLPSEDLYADCDHCGEPNGVLRYQNSSMSEHLCPECTRVEAMAVAAENQLELLVEQAVRAWGHIWPEQAAEPWLNERLNRIADALNQKLKDEAAGGMSSPHT